jgi:hypothetical protein
MGGHEHQFTRHSPLFRMVAESKRHVQATVSFRLCVKLSGLTPLGKQDSAFWRLVSQARNVEMLFRRHVSLRNQYGWSDHGSSRLCRADQPRVESPARNPKLPFSVTQASQPIGDSVTTYSSRTLDL